MAKGKIKKAAKKTGKVISAPVRVPVKKIKEHHQKRKAEKKVMKEFNKFIDSDEFEDMVQTAFETFKAAADTTATEEPEVTIEPEPNPA